MMDTKASHVPKQELISQSTGQAYYIIDRGIENFIQECRHCLDYLPSNVKEPMISKSIPDRPFQQIASDFGSYGGRQFLIVVNCKTNWPDIIDMGKDTHSTSIHCCIEGPFLPHICTQLLWSDVEPRFTSSDLANFLKTWGASHTSSSPLSYYPQSNCKVEASAKSMKKLILTAWTGQSVDWNKLSHSLLQYRNTSYQKWTLTTPKPVRVPCP